MNRPFKMSICLLALHLAATGLIAAQSRGLGVFEDYVERTFQSRCYECHSHDAKKAKGGLMLDSRRAILRGGDSGPAVVPGKSAASLLLKAVSYEDDDLQMPPDGKLANSEIKYIREWINQGAPHTNEGADPTQNVSRPLARNLWSLQPLRKPEQKSVDEFIQTRLKPKKLAFSPAAKPHELLRRLHYVLTGLPPTSEETQRWIPRFSAPENARQAIAECIDDLLSRRQFAERWARHWLDIARYADATGATAPRSYPESWRYREYVIESFHQGKPFDQFVREQIAGDLLPHTTLEQRIEQIVATGFLSLGHVPGEDRDAEKLKLDTIDEQLEVIGRVFLGIQISCARCHDHKLDPFPTRDYYAMAGIFRSTEAGPGRRMGLGQLPAGHLPEFDETDLTWLYLDEKTRIHGAMEAAEPRNEPIHIRGETSLLGKMVRRGLPSLLEMEGQPVIPQTESGRRQLADWLVSPQNPLTARVIVNRIWHHVFGHGLVRSADNFGFTGEAPDHPELLDHLARRFHEKHHGSFKSMIRELLLTRTWQQSSAARSTAMQIDPDNRLLWRASPRRADAEVLIDGIRFVAGKLDLQPADRTIPSFRLGNQDSSRYMVIPQVYLNKRAVYWPVFRKDVPISMDLLALFNFPAATGPSGVREAAAAPSQSLALMNSPLVAQAARDVAESLPGDSDKQRIEALYLRLFSRQPATVELDRALTFLNRFERNLQGVQTPDLLPPKMVAWNRLCHTLLVCNEFITVP